ncbi:MAG: VOC family protein [Verrucomicrobia bacterium]|nr:VOC family protein [Verrucomicrobiota bacterium]
MKIVEIATGTLSIGAGAPNWQPTTSGCSVALEVEDFDAAIEHLRASGVRFHRDPFETPVCRMAFVLDPDGNSLGIHKRNPGHPRD